MRILTNQGAGAGNEYGANNEGAREVVVIVWGTVTNVNFEVSPDGGTTWVVLQNMTAAGSYKFPMAGGEGYQMRGNVVAGTGVYMDYF